MKKLLWIIVVSMSTIAPCTAIGQMTGPQPMGGSPAMVGPPPMAAQPPSMAPFWDYRSLYGPNRPLFLDEVFRIAATVAPGHQWMNLAFDFPFSAQDRFNLESMNLKLNSEPFWVGFIGLEVQPVQDIIVYGRMGGNIPRDTEMVMTGSGRAFFPANPGNPLLDSPPNLTPPWMWTAKDFHWWLLEGGAIRPITSTIAIEAGFRVEHWDFRLTDPRNFAQALPGAAGGGRPQGNAITCNRI